MKLSEIRNLADKGKMREALSQVDELLARASECPYLWNLRGALILLVETNDGPPPGDAAKSYLRALELNPNDLEALEGLAHFYDTIDPKPDEAKRYAREYLEKAKKIHIAMERIIAEQD